MSSKDNPCRKFQANIFNKSKCQNCFKPRESHLLNDEDLNQAKPVYGGWLLLAPEGTNFDNPLHRSRKWQRRFFILYEHGLLRYALDEMPSTLPQGTINMNQCSDVIDAETRTGQKNSLCILTPDKEHFIRAENKEIISGWHESLIVYPRTNKQNLKKKRKVEPATPQEPGPAKVTVTSTGSATGVSMPCLPSSIASVETVPASRASLWQEERRGRSTIPCSRSASCISQLSQGCSPPSTSKDDQGPVCGGRKARVESGYFSLEKAKPDSQQVVPSPSGPGALQRRSQLLEKSGALEVDSVELMETNSSSEAPPVSSTCPAATPAHRQGRSERRHLPVKPEFSLDAAQDRCSPSSVSSYRRAKSLDRRMSESSMTPDLLNFKKGWMTKLYEDGLWKKHWFVLTDQSLRYYRDSIAEEAADLDGEIDLSTCYDVMEFPVQRNYGFQIHTKECAFTLSAMTSGIRRNWIQAIMKSVRPAIAPDVTRKNIPLKLSVLKTSSLPEERAKARALLNMGHSAPTVERHPSLETATVEEEGLAQSSSNSEQRRSRIRERRREGRSKTFDWAEFRHGQPEKVECDGQAAKPEDNVNVSSASSSASSPATSPMSSASSGSSSTPAPLQGVSLEDDLERERARRREERRRRFLSVQSSMPVTMVPVSGQVRAAEPPSTGRMEMDRSLSMPESLSEDSVQRAKTPNVQVEIEQRWHQVETTPLREEKQVPINTVHSSQQNAERLPPQELAAILDKELEQTQKELVRLQEQNNLLQVQLQDARGREQSAREGYVLQATCERGFAAMEETHQKVIEDLQRQHQREVSKLLEERERLLAEETAATIAAIEAMKNAHREEMEKTQRSQFSGMGADIGELRQQYQEELQSIHRELEVLSEQYSQKCLENAHLAQALEAERQALRQCQRENQELNAHNQELNTRLAAEITRMRSCFSGDGAVPPLTHGQDLYELEVLLRVKESEIQYLKQEIHSLKDELQSALRDKKYTADKYKDIYTELSIVKAKADCDISKLKEQLLVATEALGERSMEGGPSVGLGYDIMKSKSNPDFLKKERSSLTRQVRGVRSKSVIEQVSWDS
ncbi:myosin phosphatase Rho-interacting protein isoform X18 [Brienomyrus brachyistius]|uniref:myosin phosphatase Rho-interacting protein isoform X18 n=1 Tax=Brienomyrus brachyistius TaxID=42636 RepID=UPI0020B453DD|nr:myosin phosphatase Rho-interacting protein isoform X18 [Brienomyrus brachyistius]